MATGPSTAPRQVVIVANPRAGSGRGSLRHVVRLAEEALAAGGDEVALLRPESPEETTRLVAQAVSRGVDMVAVAGGDGTLHTAIQALAGTKTPLAILPVGTTNVLAQELGIPCDPAGAVRVLRQGRVAPMDLGLANGRYFAVSLGVGFDAATTMNMLPPLKRVAGMMAYTVAGMQTFFGHRASRMRIRTDSGRYRRLVYMAVVSNTALYGPAWSITPDADPSDGLLDACLFLAKNGFSAWLSFGRVIFGRNRDAPDVEFFRARALEIRTARPVPYQLDGDPVGFTPLKVAIAPAALEVVRP